MDPQRAAEVKAAFEKHSKWIESQEGVRGCSLGIDPEDRDVIRVLTDPAQHEEVSAKVRDKVGDYVYFIPANPKPHS